MNRRQARPQATVAVCACWLLFACDDFRGAVEPDLASFSLEMLCLPDTMQVGASAEAVVAVLDASGRDVTGFPQVVEWTIEPITVGTLLPGAGSIPEKRTVRAVASGVAVIRVHAVYQSDAKDKKTEATVTRSVTVLEPSANTVTAKALCVESAG